MDATEFLQAVPDLAEIVKDEDARQDVMLRL